MKRDDKTRDLELGRSLRDAGMESVSQHRRTFMVMAWDALTVVRHDLPALFTGEDIRMAMQLRGLEAPDSHCWGALTCHAIKKKLFQYHSGDGRMKAPRSHARRTPLYRWADAA